MKSLIVLNIIKNSNKWLKLELNLLLIKSIFSDLRFFNVIRFFFLSFVYNSMRTRLNYFCIKTKQIRGLFHFFNVFRMQFRTNALFAKYSGIKKKSW